MKSDIRLFAPFPIEMDEHPKIFPLSDAAFRALFEATFYSRRMLSDGFLDERVVLKRWGREVADELSSNDPERPSWIKVDGGWQIHDFDKHHTLKADVVALKESRAAAGRAGGRASANQRASKTQANGKQNASKSNPETETETETEASSPLAKTRLSKDWAPTAAHIAYAADKGIDVAKEVTAFRLHAETHDRHAARWNAAFTTWLSKSTPTPAKWRGGEPDWMNNV